MSLSKFAQKSAVVTVICILVLSVTLSTVIIPSVFADGTSNPDAPVTDMTYNSIELGQWKGDNPTLDNPSYDATEDALKTDVSYVGWAARYGGVSLSNTTINLPVSSAQNRFLKIRARADANSKQFAFDGLIVYAMFEGDGTYSWIQDGYKTALSGMHNNEQYVEAIIDMAYNFDVKKLVTLRLDISTATPTDGYTDAIGGSYGSMYIDYIGFFDTKQAAEAYAETKSTDNTCHFTSAYSHAAELGKWQGDNASLDALLYDPQANAGSVGVAYYAPFSRFGGISLSNTTMNLPVSSTKNRFIKVRVKADENSKKFAFDGLIVYAMFEGDGTYSWIQDGYKTALSGLHNNEEYVEGIIDMAYNFDAKKLVTLRMDINTATPTAEYPDGVGGNNGRLLIDYIGFFDSLQDAQAFTLTKESGSGTEGETSGTEGETSGTEGEETGTAYDISRLPKGIAYNFANGLKNGWDKTVAGSDVSLDKSEHAVKMAPGVTSLTFTPTEEIRIGDNKNRYIKVRVKSNDSLTGLIAYFITQAEEHTEINGSTVRAFQNGISTADGEYVDAIFDMYDNSTGFGAEWVSALKVLRLDFKEFSGEFAHETTGNVYVKYVGFFDTLEAAKAFNGDFSKAEVKDSSEGESSKETEIDLSKVADLKNLPDGIAFNFAHGFKYGWDKQNPLFDIVQDKQEGAIKIHAPSGASIIYQPSNTFVIGENKNRYVKIRLKADPSLNTIIAYFITQAESHSEINGSTVRVFPNCVKPVDGEYVDCIFDMYDRSTGYGADWVGALKILQINFSDLSGEFAVNPTGDIYVKYIGFFDTLAAAKAFDGDFALNGSSHKSPTTGDADVQNIKWAMLFVVVSFAIVAVTIFAKKNANKKFESAINHIDVY